MNENLKLAKEKYKLSQYQIKEQSSRTFIRDRFKMKTRS